MDKTQASLSEFQYQGVNRSGEKISGIISASTLTVAKVELRKQGIITKSLVKKSKPLFSKRQKKISAQDISVFSRQLATMIQSGIPLVQSFDIVAKGQQNDRMKELIENVKRDVESGLTLTEALQKHPRYFGKLFANLVDAGEKSGSLDIMLAKIATYQEKIESIKKKIKKALTYPIAVMIVAILVTIGLLLFVVPQFESIFKGFGADLPILTRMVIDMSRWVQSYWYIVLGLVIAVVSGLIYAKRTSPQFVRGVDKLLLKVPVIGSIVEKAAIARFARTLSITFAAGLPLVDALNTVAGATGNIVFSEATLKIRDEVSIGQQMHLAMENTHVFPNMVVQMVAVGEESGALEQMLGKVAAFYEEEVDTAVDSLSSLLEPIIMCVLGVLVGGLVVAMYLPIFKLGSVV